MSRIPIKSLKELSKKYNLDHVIVFATEGDTQHIATYGVTIDGCSEAADFGNKLRDVMGWPESLHQQPSRVRRLQKRIKELEAERSQGNDTKLPSEPHGSKQASTENTK